MTPEPETPPEGTIDTQPIDEGDRIARWRAERAAVAEAEKKERLRTMASDREAQALSEATQRRAEADALLPDAAEIARTRARLLTRSKQHAATLFWQIALFVLLPTALMFGYLSLLAVPLYEAQSVVVVSKPGGKSDPQLGGFLGAIGGPANLNEAFMAQEYIRSQAMMDALEQDIGLTTTLSSDQLDPASRLRDISFLQISKHDLFGRFVESAINIQTGLITLYVRMPDPAMSITVSDAVLAKVTTQINSLSDDLFEQGIEQNRVAVQEARTALTRAQADLVKLQISTGEADPAAHIASILAIIQQLEAERQDLLSQAQSADVAGNATTYLSDKLKKLQDLLEIRIEEQRRLLVGGTGSGGTSLNSLLLDHELKVLEVKMAEEALTATRVALSKATDDAARGRSIFQIVVPPRSATYPSQPRVLISTLVTLLILLSLFSVVNLLLPQRPRSDPAA